MDSEAKDLIEKLGLIPHVEEGWYRFMWSSDIVIPRDVLPEKYSGERKSASLIYYLLEESSASLWHKLHSTEIWVWHSGGSLKMTLGGEGPRPRAEKELFLGPRYADGESFHIVVPAALWQTAELVSGTYVLVSCIVSPAFHADDFILYKED